MSTSDDCTTVKDWCFCFTEASDFDNRFNVMITLSEFFRDRSKEIVELPGLCFIGGFGHDGLIKAIYAIKTIERRLSKNKGDEVFYLSTSNPRVSYCIHMNDISEFMNKMLDDMKKERALSLVRWYYTPHYRHSRWWL